MQGLESSEHVDDVPPDEALRDVAALLAVAVDFLEYIASSGVLHDYAQRLLLLIVEGLLVADDVGAVDRGEDADLVESVLLFYQEL